MRADGTSSSDAPAPQVPADLVRCSDRQPNSRRISGRCDRAVGMRLRD